MKEVGRGRGSRFLGLADLTLNHGAWSSGWHPALTVKPTAAKKSMFKCVLCVLHVMLYYVWTRCKARHMHVGVCAHMHTSAYCWTSVILWSYFCVVCVCSPGATPLAEFI